MRFQNMIGTGSYTVNAFNKNLINLFGNVIKKQISGVDCYGPGLTRFMDVQTDFTGLVTLSGVSQKTANGRKFIVSTVAAGVASVALYSVDSQNNDTPLGRILVTFPNQGGTTTHTVRFIRVLDSGTTNWTIVIGTVAGTTTVNGGAFRVHKVNLSDFSFSPSPVQFFMQIANDSKGVYMMQDPTAVGAAHAMRDFIGGGVDGTELITARGTAANLSHDGFDLTQVPTIPSFVCTGATSIGSPIFTMTGHPFAVGDAIVPTANTPGGFTQANGASTQVVYYVSATGFGANNFQLSTTPGGSDQCNKCCHTNFCQSIWNINCGIQGIKKNDSCGDWFCWNCNSFGFMQNHHTSRWSKRRCEMFLFANINKFLLLATDLNCVRKYDIARKCRREQSWNRC
jgi:hypothetical protein